MTADRRAVVAIGGNALILDGQRGSIDEQYENARETARHIAAMVATGWGVVVTHGNGPQVGFILLRSEAVPEDLPVPRLNLEMSVADSQGGFVARKHGPAATQGSPNDPGTGQDAE